MNDCERSRDADTVVPVDPEFLVRALELHSPNITHAADDGTMLPLEPPAYGGLGEIRVPALVMVGEYDFSRELAFSDYQLAHLPDATGAVIADAAHLPTVERRDESTRVLLEWLDRHGL